MKRGLFQFHLSTVLMTVWMIGVLMTVQYYRYRALNLDAPLEMFANPAKDPAPVMVGGFPYFGRYDIRHEDPMKPSPEAIAFEKQLKFEFWWRSHWYGFLLPWEWFVFLIVPILSALIWEYVARRHDRRKGRAREFRKRQWQTPPRRLN